MPPGELQGVGKGSEVGNGPLVAIGTAGAEQVASEVQVEAQEDQHSGEPGMRRGGAAAHARTEGEVGQARHQERCESTEQGETEIVQAVMV